MIAATYAFTALLILVLISSNPEAHPVASAVKEAGTSDLAGIIVRPGRVATKFKQGEWRSNLMGKPKGMGANHHRRGSSAPHIKKKKEEMYKMIQKKGEEAHKSWLNSYESILKALGHH